MRKLFGIFTFIWIFCMMLSLTGCDANHLSENQTDKNTTSVVTTEIDIHDNTQQSTVEIVEEDKSDVEELFTITVENKNSWESEGLVCAQFQCVIDNISDVQSNDWFVEIEIPEGSKLMDSWNGTYTLKENSLTVLPVDYNKQIEAKSSIEFGFIIGTPEAFEAKDVTLKVDDVQYTLQDKSATPTTQVNQTYNHEEPINEQEKTTDITWKQSDAPFSKHGSLSVKGTKIADQNGKVFQLKGVSTHGINWFPEYVNKEAFWDLSGYGVNAIRLAMYTADYNGYCSGGNQEQLEQIIDKGVKACTELGMYVIIDWHILNDKDPNQNKQQAVQFFEKMSRKYKDNGNVIYEICNEPNGGTDWSQIKSYALDVIPVIRKNDSDALIIVGTPNWSQDVDIASKDPITNYDNILYAVHFYAATHKNEIREKVITAIQNGLPIIVSESNISEASGNGSLNYEEGNKWMDLISQYQLSCFAWSLGNKDETSSFIKSSVSKNSGFTQDDFTDSGLWYLEQYQK